MQAFLSMEFMDESTGHVELIIAIVFQHEYDIQCHNYYLSYILAHWKSHLLDQQ